MIFHRTINHNDTNNWFFFQGHDEQKDEGDGGAGAELCQLKPAAAEGTAGRTEQLSGAVPG